MLCILILSLKKSCTLLYGRDFDFYSSVSIVYNTEKVELSNNLINDLKINKIFLLYSVSSLIGEGDGTPLQYSCLENPMDGGTWWAAVHGAAKSRARLSNFTFTFHFHALEKEMATHSSVLAWRIPGTGDPGGLPSMGSHRVGHD